MMRLPAPGVASVWCAESYHDVPFIRDRISSQSFILEQSQLFGTTGVRLEEYLALWYWLIFWYM